jgi:hypothetical protein
LPLHLALRHLTHVLLHRWPAHRRPPHLARGPLMRERALVTPLAGSPREVPADGPAVPPRGTGGLVRLRRRP